MKFADNLENSKILIVDDNPENLKTFIVYLEEHGFNISFSLNGKQALKNVKHIMPDLIFLDVVMPEMDGFQCCRLLKEDEATKDIPIIFMTALTDTIDEIKGFELGAVDYITKPIKLERVLARMNAHLTIQRQKKELKKLNATKDRFFSIIAHDLKAPFISLMSIINLMDQNEVELTLFEIREYIDDLKSSTEIAYEFLQNLLNWAQLQQKQMTLTFEKIKLAAIVNKFISLYKERANQKNIQINNDISPESLIYADSMTISTVIRNLIDNAIKFTNPGGQVTISSISYDNSFEEIVITDTGIGIGAIGLQKLFHMDQKYKTIGTAGENGTGLGLILCKDFVEANGGTIWVESEKGKGSAFKFTVPRWIDEEK
jgi:two-component system sensor histidine kinase/response regulator